jgi:hypothetical protein
MIKRELDTRVIVDLIALILCAAGSVFALSHTHGPVAAFIILAGSVLGCGWAITGWIDTRDAAYAASLAMAAGLALVMVVSLVSIELAWWHPVIVVGVMSAIAALGNGGLSYRDIQREGGP